MDEIVIIGGPNGAGKTTAAQLLVLHGLVIYDNSDGQRTLIAERLPKGSLVVRDAGRWATIERARP